jgi:ribosomal-protein-alanine N-acetyltransferase
MQDGPESTELRTERLSLTRPQVHDVAAILEITNDSRATSHNHSDRIETHADAEELLARWTAHWGRHGFGYWVVREIDADVVVGFCGVKLVSFREQNVLNLFYRFAAPSWGRGIASEAAATVLGWVDRCNLEPELIARVRPANVASQRVLEKIGFERATNLDDDGEDGLDWIYLRRSRSGSSVARG